MPNSTAEHWMSIAIAEAVRAGELGEVPVGAIVVNDDQIVATGHNLTHTVNDPSAHAEMVAIRRAAAATEHWRLLDCTLYVTLEPCAMCAGAIVLARIPRLVYGAADPKAGMCGSLENLVEDPRLNHRVDVVSGVLAEESGDLLEIFLPSTPCPNVWNERCSASAGLKIPSSNPSERERAVPWLSARSAATTITSPSR